MVDVNLNQIAKVKLTSYGIDILKQQHKDFCIKFPHLKFDFNHPRVDKDGYT